VKVERSVVVDRDSGDVFAFLSELENHARFVPGLLEFRLLTNIGPGAEAIGTRRAFGRVRRLPYRVTTFVAGQAIGVRTRLGPLEGTAEYRVQGMADGRTHVTMASDYRASRPFGFVNPILVRMARRDTVIVTANLKRALETPGV
jgi:carbon monoxide dehydrogenase subunit G